MKIGPTDDCSSSLCLLVRATDNLDAISFDRIVVIQLEIDVFQKESPHVVTKPIGRETALETKSCLDFIRDNFRKRFIKLFKDLDC